MKNFGSFCCMLALLVGILLSACKREPQQPYRAVWTELDSIADRSFFPTGISRWIYEDSASKQLDTVTLVELRADTVEVYYLEPPILYYTKVDKRIVLYSSRFQKTLSYYTDLKSPFNSDYAVISKNSYYFALAPLERKLTFYTPFGPSGVVGYYSSYSSNDVSYMNVAKIEMLGEPQHNFEHNIYYFAPNTGLIKHENLTTNQVWQLKQVD